MIGTTTDHSKEAGWAGKNPGGSEIPSHRRLLGWASLFS